MDIITDMEGSNKEIISCIQKYGSVREHNYWFFYNQQTNYAKVHFFRFKDKGIFSIRYKSGTWELIGEVLAPENDRIKCFKLFLEYVLSTKKDKKLFVFVPEKFYNNISLLLHESSGYKITKNPSVYHTPVFNLKKWDESLSGKDWKKLRNIRNRFMKSYNIEFIPSREIEKKKLIDIVLKWRKHRAKVNVTYYTQMYMNFIKNDFGGTDLTRSITVNDEPCTITAGWKIPNSNNYYSAIGLYNYKYPGLGEVANIDDLTEIKKKNFDLADFGDSADSLLYYKKKFRPDHFYKTYWFYIKKRGV